MRYPLLRHTPATSLVGMLCLTASLLLAVVTVPASAATPAEDSGKSTAGVEIVIKSDDEVRTTFVTTAPASGEEILKKSCVEENFSQASSKPEMTFSNENGTPTCRAMFNTPISKNDYVSHDGNEYVVDTHLDSVSEADKKKTVALTVIFPGKVTDADGGKVEGDGQNKVSFDNFYDHKTRGQDNAKTSSQATSTSSSKAGLTIIIVMLAFIAVVGGVIAFVGNENKKKREQKYLAALEQQPLQAGALGSVSQPLTYPAPTQGGPAPAQPFQAQPSYSPTPQPYQQSPNPVPSGTGGLYPPPNQNGYSSY